MSPTETGAESVEKLKEEIDPRCIVKFRPADDWEGEYGFDWFREGDYGELTIDNQRDDHYISDNNGNLFHITSKTNYKNDLVGRYYGDFRLCVGDVNNPIVIQHKDEFTDTNGNPIYTTNTGSGKYYTTFHLQSICSNCHNRANCSILPSPSNNSQEEVLWIDEYTGSQNPIDPDWKSFLIQVPSLEFDKQDALGNTIPKYYENAFIKNNYNTIRIGEDQNYIIPTISLFYKNEIKENQGKWGKSKATIKLLIDGKNIDTDRHKITLEFECSEGIETLNPISLGGNNIQKNTSNIYETQIDVNLTEKFSKNKRDGSIKVYAKTTSNRFLAGKLSVEKCIPKSVDIVFVHIPIQLNPTERPSARTDINDQELNLKRYLSQAHIIPNIITSISFRTEDQDTQKKLNEIIDNHKQVRPNTNIAIALDPKDDLGKQLEDLFNQDNPDPKYRNAYKIFLLAANGRIDLQGGGQLFGQANAIPSKAAVIFSLDNFPGTSATVCHELLHCFGLFHSYSNNSPFTLKQFETSNIMDYTGDGHSPDLLTLWKWQWKKIRLASGVQSMENQWKVL